MMAPYLLRLVCLSFAVFFAVHFAAGLLVIVTGRPLVRAARGLRPSVAARLLLAVRLLPAGLGVLVVAGICVPSYLWLEPELSREEIGVSCLAAAILGAVLWALAGVRGLSGVIRASRHSRACMHLGRPAGLAGFRLPIRVLDTQAPLFALVGVFRSGVVVSDAVVQQLTPPQLAAALRHEEAHLDARDNLKRLVLLLTPGLLPGFHGFQGLECDWARLIEWSADDQAVAGDNRRSLSLAAALVRMARLGGSPATPLTAAFMSNCGEVSARVDRLLNPAPVAPLPNVSPAMTLAAVTVVAGLVVGMLHPATLSYAHRIFENVIH
ncbi:MAG: M56 family metallopeptidase [Candidatus Solibacter sp.]